MSDSTKEVRGGTMVFAAVSLTEDFATDRVRGCDSREHSESARYVGEPLRLLFQHELGGLEESLSVVVAIQRVVAVARSGFFSESESSRQL